MTKKKKTKKRSKVKRKTKKRSKVKKKTKKEKKNNQELLIKTKSEWIRKALVNKSEYEKKYNLSIKKNDEFWKKDR